MRLSPFLSCISPPLEQSDAEKSRAKLYLNVYDVTPVNNYLYWFGLGMHHSGIEAHGVEYGFALDEKSTSGVFKVEPRSCPGYTFRRSILLGSVDMSSSEFRAFMERLSEQYHGDSYDLFLRNCNHFTNEACHRLTGKPIPAWVNRLARLGYFVESLLCETGAPSDKDLPENQLYSEDRVDFGVSSVAGESGAEELQHLLRK